MAYDWNQAEPEALEAALDQVSILEAEIKSGFITDPEEIRNSRIWIGKVRAAAAKEYEARTGVKVVV